MLRLFHVIHTLLHVISLLGKRPKRTPQRYRRHASCNLAAHVSVNETDAEAGGEGESEGRSTAQE